VAVILGGRQRFTGAVGTGGGQMKKLAFASMIIANKTQLADLSRFIADELTGRRNRSWLGFPNEQTISELLVNYFHNGKKREFS
jgi:hypothetical protein